MFALGTIGNVVSHSDALACTEGEAILRALINNVTHIEAGQPVRYYKNVLRGLESLPVILTKA